MFKKIIALFTLFCFLFLMSSCYSYRVETIEETLKRPKKLQEIKILAVMDKDSTWWTLSKPGDIRMGSIVALASPSRKSGKIAMLGKSHSQKMAELKKLEKYALIKKRGTYYRGGRK